MFRILGTYKLHGFMVHRVICFVLLLNEKKTLVNVIALFNFFSKKMGITCEL